MSRKPYKVLLSLALCLVHCGGLDPNVWTHHNDVFRTGSYVAEEVLTPDRVRDRGMRVTNWVPPCDGVVGIPPPADISLATGCISGAIEAQPLFVREIQFVRWLPAGIVTTKTDGLFVATLNNKVYGLDAGSLARMWETDLMRFVDGSERYPGYFARGIASTPVIDVANRLMYVVYGIKKNASPVAEKWEDQPSWDAWKDPKTHDKALSQSTGLDAQYWLAVLAIGSGALLKQVRISAPGFSAPRQIGHPALLLDHGSVHLAFGSVAWAEAFLDFSGWIFRYRATDLVQQAVLRTSSTHAGVWQGGGGLAADSDGALYFLTGDGPATSHLTHLGDRAPGAGTVTGSANPGSVVGTSPGTGTAVGEQHSSGVATATPNTRPVVALDRHTGVTGGAIDPRRVTLPCQELGAPMPRPNQLGNSFVRLKPNGGGFGITAFVPTDAALMQANDADLGSGGAMIIPGSNVVIERGKDRLHVRPGADLHEPAPAVRRFDQSIRPAGER